MTEKEWLTATDVESMLATMHLSVETVPRLLPRPTDRKLRLTTSAIVRQIWPLLTDEESSNAVVVAERYADAQATFAELLAARDLKSNHPWTSPEQDTLWAVTCTDTRDIGKYFYRASRYLVLTIVQGEQTELLRTEATLLRTPPGRSRS